MSDVLVVKLGGANLADAAGLLLAIAEEARRRPVIVVHGGGARLTAWQERLGLPARFEEGRRVTDAATLEVALAVLGGLVNGELVAGLRRLGADAVGLSGIDGGLLLAERIPATGFVARVIDIRRGLLDALLVGGQLPVVAPLAMDETGAICNVNADEAAAGISRGIGARQLVLLSDVSGVRGPDGTTLTTLDAPEAERLLAAGTVGGGMRPKVRAALRAVAGLPGTEAVIADGGAPEALARAITDPTFGTRIRGPREPGLSPAATPARARRATRPSWAETG